MRVVARYSFKGGSDYIQKHHSVELLEVEEVIRLIEAEKYKTKISKEKTTKGERFFAPILLNENFKKLLEEREWKTGVRIEMETTVPEVGEGYKYRGFRAIDAVKNKLGVEVQFGKYSFMVYNVAAKMTIFSNRGIIDTGVEIVPMHRLASEMSSGVSFFEQFKSDLEARGESDIDIPVLILGIDV